MSSSSKLFNKLKGYAQLMRLDKPIGTLLLSWPTLWSLWLAGFKTDLNSGLNVGLSIESNATDQSVWVNNGIQPDIVLVFMLGVFLMRSAGCVINDFADRKIDKHVERTQFHPLTSGRVTTREALALFCILISLALLAVLSLNDSVRYEVLAWSIPALLCAIAYPFMKRYFATPQLVLGIAFSFAIPMTYAAYGHGWEAWQPVLLLVLANIAWVVAYDTQYAMVDRDDDVKIGVRSTAIFFGSYDVNAVVTLQLLSVAFLVAVGCVYTLNSFYYVALSTTLVLIFYQWLLIRNRDQKQCFSAFLSNTWFGAIVWFAVLLATSVGV